MKHMPHLPSVTWCALKSPPAANVNRWQARWVKQKGQVSLSFLFRAVAFTYRQAGGDATALRLKLLLI